MTLMLSQPVVRQVASQRRLSLQQCSLGCLSFLPILNRFIIYFSSNVPIQILYETIDK